MKTKQSLKENFNNYNLNNSSKKFNETAPLEKNSYYETFKQMKRNAEMNQIMKTAPTVIFSPSNETFNKLVKMMESDQKELEEKFSHQKNT